MCPRYIYALYASFSAQNLKMASLKFMSLVFVVMLTVPRNCDSLSLAMPPNYLLPGPHELVSVSNEPTSPPEPMLAPYPSPPKHRSKGIKGAYWPSFNNFPASSIDTSYFTHIYYAFLLPEPATFKLNVTQFDLAKMSELISVLRAQNLPIKILLSIGGGGNHPEVFSKMASSKETRATFINSTVEIARKYGFDGVDLDWEFPADDQDMANLGLLFRQWRKALNHEAGTSGNPRLLLTSAVYYASKFTTIGEHRSYPADAIKNYVDWVSPMCFNYHGSWENFTGMPAALYDPSGNLSNSYGIGSWIQVGVPPEKLVMGLPLYGRTWRLKDPTVHGIGAPALGVGPGAGILTYSQIVDFNTVNCSTVKFDDETVAYYSYAGDSWIGYDDVKSVKRKVRFAKSRGLAGYFFWALGQDKNWTIARKGTI